MVSFREYKFQILKGLKHSLYIELYKFVVCNSTILAIKKDLSYIMLQILTNLAKVIHFDEIDGYIKFLDDTFGKGSMAECIEYLLRLII